MAASELATLDSPVLSTTATALPASRPQFAAQVTSDFTVTFWGVRGSVPTPNPETIRYGGNTACIELNVAGKRLIFDAGTGICNLGKHMMNQGGGDRTIPTYLFFTQTQWDRIQGFPFFVPAFIEGNSFEIYGAAGTNGASIKQRLAEQMLRPNFSAPLHQMRAQLNFHDITPGSLTNLDDIVIETISLSHCNSALGYRIAWDGRSIIYAIDSEHPTEQPDQALLYLAQDADLLIFDTAYVDHDYYAAGNVAHNAAHNASHPQPATWKTGIEVANAAQVKQVVMFHHDPTYEDDFIDQLEQQAQSSFANIQFAREGRSISIL